MVRYRTPYHFGSPVGPEHFADRGEELGLLTARMRGGLNVIVHAPRRYGKTSLLKRAVEETASSGVAVGYVNLLRCSTRRELSQAVTRAVFAGPLGGRDLAKRLGRLLDRIRIRPKVELAPDGTFTVGFDPQLAERDWTGALEDVCHLLADEGARRPVALAVDEFQQISEIDRGLAGVFKAILDDAPDVSFVLAGSHVHLMEKLTSQPGAPLLNMGEVMRLEPIPQAEMVAYLIRRARSARRPMTKATAERLCELAGPVPNDIQRLAQEAFDLSGSEGVKAEAVQRALELGAARQATTFSERFERLGGVAQRLLKLLAEEPVAKPYSREVLVRLEAANDNAVRKALGVLRDAELVAYREGSWDVSDPFLRQWLRTPPE